MNIQKAGVHHISGIMDTWVEFMDFLHRTNSDYWQVRNGHSAFSNYLLSILEEPDVLVAVAEDEGRKIIGFSLALIEILPEWFGSEQIGLIRYLVVSEDYRGLGIGHDIVAFVLDWFRSLGIHRIELYVLKNLPASSFWSKVGFKEFMDRRFLEI